MNVKQAIEALEQARQVVGDDAPVLMVDSLPVVRFQPSAKNGCVWVSDAESNETDPRRENWDYEKDKEELFEIYRRTMP